MTAVSVLPRLGWREYAALGVLASVALVIWRWRRHWRQAARHQTMVELLLAKDAAGGMPYDVTAIHRHLAALAADDAAADLVREADERIKEILKPLKSDIPRDDGRSRERGI